MELHVDNDEKDFSYPVLSISIGNSALFRFGGLQRSDKTKSIKLNNRDILIMQDESRLIYHGINRIYQSNLFDYRINLRFNNDDKVVLKETKLTQPLLPKLINNIDGAI